MTAKYVLELINRAYELFLRSEVQERRQLITLILQNVRLNGKKLVWDVQKPFDVLLENNHRKRWRQTRGALRTFRWISIREKLPFLANKEKGHILSIQS